MIASKITFLKETFPALLHTLDAQQKGVWGLMNAQQMVEHFAESIELAYGKIQFPALTAGEQQQKMYQFMMSDAPFRENTVNPHLPKEPVPARTASMDEAIKKLTDTLFQFFAYYHENPGAKVENPFFGNLNFEEQVQLLHKHARHHLKQFGLLQ
ncbi:MAG TPA: DUF1569 domain-containing protein [Phnomibacter sp.]|nr:DUF1569 domain-containing protein [Phnomibacter sp.]